MMRLVLTLVAIGACSSPKPQRTVVQPRPSAKPNAPGLVHWVPLDRPFIVDHIQTDASVRCAVSRGGQVACWGATDRGEATRNRHNGVGTPQLLAGVDDVIDVGVVWFYVCVAQRNGNGRCFLTSDSLKRPPPRFPVAPVELAKDEGRLCARMRDGSVGCIDFDGKFTPITGLANARRLACSAGTCCAVTTTGVACFSTHTAKPLAEKVPPATAIVLDRNAGCVRTQAGGAYCWGAAKGLTQQAGVRSVGRADQGLCVVRDDGTLRCSDERVPPGSEVVQVDDRCRVHASGAVTCYGDNQFGELGDGHATLSTTPRRVAGLDDVVELRVAHTSACAVRKTGELKCWGEGPLVDLGKAGGPLIPGQQLAGCRIASGAIRCNVPSARGWDSQSFVPKVTGIKAAAVHRDNAICVVDSAGKVQCGLADAHWVALGAPGPVEELQPLAGGFCARLGDGRVGCFVDHKSDADKLPKGTLETVAGIKDATQLATSQDEACAITKPGEVWCWNADHPKPVELPALRGATAIAANHQHACAVVRGEVWCWGANNAGQLGTGAVGPERVKTPVRANISFKAVRVGVGRDSTCALDDRGHVWCWGSDKRGELGQSRPIFSEQPSRVVGLGPR